MEAYIQSIDRLEAKLSKLENHHRNEETLPYQSLTIPDTSSHIDETEESWCLRDFDQDSISAHQFELDQSQILDKLVSLHFKEIELDCECEPDSQLCDLVSIFDSIFTPVSLPNLDLIFEADIASYAHRS